MHGTCESATLHYIIRDHSKEVFSSRKHTLSLIEKLINEKYGLGTVKLTMIDSYQNMADIFEGNMDQIEIAMQAIRQTGIEPVTYPIRGGTDGARLSFMGLPCPNLCTGGYAYHGPYEHITIEGLEACTKIIVEIVKQYAAKIVNA